MQLLHFLLYFVYHHTFCSYKTLLLMVTEFYTLAYNSPTLPQMADIHIHYCVTG